MNSQQIVTFRQRHGFVKRLGRVRCLCGWRPPAGTPIAQIPRAALTHLNEEKSRVEHQGSQEVLFT